MHAALQEALNSPYPLLLEQHRYKDTIWCTLLGAEVPAHLQEQLLQTLTVPLLRTFCSKNWEEGPWPPLRPSWLECIAAIKMTPKKTQFRHVAQTKTIDWLFDRTRIKLIKKGRSLLWQGPHVCVSMMLIPYNNTTTVVDYRSNSVFNYVYFHGFSVNYCKSFLLPILRVSILVKEWNQKCSWRWKEKESIKTTALAFDQMFYF